MTTLATAAATTPDDGKIVCMIDNARVHSVQVHLRANHPDWNMERYQATYPDAPLLSEAAMKQIAARQKAKANEGAATAAGATDTSSAALKLASTFVKQPFHDIFGLGATKAARRPNGDPILIDVGSAHAPQNAALVPDIDPNYVFSIEETKDAIIALALKMPCYVWGYHGTGKTSLIDQVHARVKRPLLRVQHTINTEEADIVGQWTVRSVTRKVKKQVIQDGELVEVEEEAIVTETHFQLGPLAMAMIEGWTYLADEYDFAAPSVTAVYQPVLEGKPLVIKNAPEEFRIIKPHENFRFFATGNTNGIGDESGLYQGTQMGNAANYSRFGLTIQIDYMPPKMEAIVIANQSSCAADDATKIVDVCTSIRKAYKAGQIGSTISPREAINTAILGLARANWRAGFERAYLNRLSRTDKEVVAAFAQRVWA